MALRPATPDELRQLQRSARSIGHTTYGTAWLAATSVLIVLGVAYLVTGVRTVGESLVVLLLGVAGLLGYLRLRRLFAPHIAAERAGATADAAMTLVDETTFEVVDTIEVEEQEDEGRHFYLGLHNGSVVFLSGQYLYDAVKAKRFPAARVTIVRAPTTHTVLSLATSGEYRAPSTVREPFSDRDHERGRVPQDGDLLSIDFDELRK